MYLEISETLDEVSVSTSFAQFWSVSVLITMIFISLHKSRSQHLWNSRVSMSVSLDKCSNMSLEPNLLVSFFIVSTNFVLVWMFLWSWSQSRLWESDFFSLGLSLVIETHIFQSRSRSRHWDSNIFSLGLVIETQTFSVSISVLSMRFRPFLSQSRWSKSGLVDPWFR